MPIPLEELPNREAYGEEFVAFITESEGSYVRDGTGGPRVVTEVEGPVSGAEETGGVGVDEELATARLALHRSHFLPAVAVCDSQGFGGDGAILLARNHVLVDRCRRLNQIGDDRQFGLCPRV